MARKRRGRVKEDCKTLRDSDAGETPRSDSGSGSWDASWRSGGGGGSARRSGGVLAGVGSDRASGGRDRPAWAEVDDGDDRLRNLSDKQLWNDCLESLRDRRRWLREWALQRAVRLSESGYRADLWDATDAYWVFEAVRRVVLRRGAAAEMQLAARLVSIGALTVAGAEGPDAVASLLRDTGLHEALLAQLRGRVAEGPCIAADDRLVEALSVSAFAAAAHNADALESAMGALADMLRASRTRASAITSSDDSATSSSSGAFDRARLEGVIRGWALLASVLSPPEALWRHVTEMRVQETLRDWATEPHRGDAATAELQRAAVEAVALIMERCNLSSPPTPKDGDVDIGASPVLSTPIGSDTDDDDTGGERDGIRASPARPPRHPARATAVAADDDNAVARLGSTLQDVLSVTQARRHRLGRRHRNAVRHLERSASGNLLADRVIVSDGREQVCATSYAARRQLDAARRVLGGGLTAHLQHNAFLRQFLLPHAPPLPALDDRSASPSPSDYSAGRSVIDTARERSAPRQHKRERQRARRLKHTRLQPHNGDEVA